MSLDELELEQTEIQLDPNDEKKRSRRIAEYSATFNFEVIAKRTGDKSWKEKGILKILENIVKKKGRAVWVDLACGNAVALREGRKYFHETYGDVDLLKAYGFDALRVEMGRIREFMERHHNHYPSDLLDPTYNPTFAQVDITDVKFPETPDLITCIEAVYYTNDPMEVIANATRQAQIGTTMCMTGLSRLHLLDPGSDLFEFLFRKYLGKLDTLPGFETLGLTNIMPDDLILVKTEEIEDPKYGFTLAESKQSNRQGGFNYYYREA
jgi:hypothetical protein